MKYLLDTHVFLWCLTDDKNLSQTVRDKICDENNIIFVSAVNTWEIVIKKAIGKLEAPEDLEFAILKSRFTILPIHVSHTLEVAKLPLKHSDPFDRLLIAQTKVEGLTLITQDKQIMKYDDISILWADE